MPWNWIPWDWEDIGSPDVLVAIITTAVLIVSGIVAWRRRRSFVTVTFKNDPEHVKVSRTTGGSPFDPPVHTYLRAFVKAGGRVRSENVRLKLTKIEKKEGGRWVQRMAEPFPLIWQHKPGMEDRHLEPGDGDFVDVVLFTSEHSTFRPCLFPQQPNGDYFFPLSIADLVNETGEFRFTVEATSSSRKRRKKIVFTWDGKTVTVRPSIWQRISGRS